MITVLRGSEREFSIVLGARAISMEEYSRRVTASAAIFTTYKLGIPIGISGLKKRGTNRHWAGNGKIQIDRDVVEDYLELKKWYALPMDEYVVVGLINDPAKDLSRNLENEKK